MKFILISILTMLASTIALAMPHSGDMEFYLEGVEAPVTFSFDKNDLGWLGVQANKDKVSKGWHPGAKPELWASFGIEKNFKIPAELLSQLGWPSDLTLDMVNPNEDYRPYGGYPHAAKMDNHLIFLSPSYPDASFAISFTAFSASDKSRAINKSPADLFVNTKGNPFFDSNREEFQASFKRLYFNVYSSVALPMKNKQHLLVDYTRTDTSMILKQPVPLYTGTPSDGFESAVRSLDGKRIRYDAHNRPDSCDDLLTYVTFEIFDVDGKMHILAHKEQSGNGSGFGLNCQFYSQKTYEIVLVRHYNDHADLVEGYNTDLSDFFAPQTANTQTHKLHWSHDRVRICTDPSRPC